MKRIKNYKKSFVWEQFERIDGEKATCKHCTCGYKIKYGSTSGLLHLKSKHSNVFAIIDAKKESESTYSVSYLDTNSHRSKDLTTIAGLIALDLQPSFFLFFYVEEVFKDIRLS